MGKEITQELLSRVFSDGRRITYGYPYEMNKKIRYINDRRRNVVHTKTKWNKLEVGRYYLIMSYLYGSIGVNLCRIDKRDSRERCYIGESVIVTSSDFTVKGEAVNIYTEDTDMVIEVTRDFFEDVMNDIVFFKDVVGVLDQNSGTIDINNGVYERYVTYEMENGVLPYHQDISDMTVSEFVDGVRTYNHEVMSRMEDIKKYCDDNIRGKYLLYYGDREKINIMRIKDFSIGKITKKNGVSTYGIMFNNEKMTIYRNFSCSLFNNDNTFAGSLDNGNIYRVLSEDKGNALFDCYHRIRTKIESRLDDKEER